MNRVLITLLVLLGGIRLMAQSVDKEDDSWMQFIQEIAEISGNEQNINNLYEELSEIRENPFNINQITRDQLIRLPFLTEIQIQNIEAYLYTNGSMLSLYELKMVKDMDQKTIQLMLPFVYLGPPKPKQVPSWKESFKHIKQMAYFRFDTNLNRKVGYTTPSDSADTRYLGSPAYSFLKYDFNAGNKFQFGLLAEKDAGERPRDGFLSAYLFAKDLGVVKRLAIGRYKLSFGQGLVMNTNFAMSKSIMAANVESSAEGVSRHFSTDEINYLQGIAVTLSIFKQQISLFVSDKKATATLNDSVLSSIKSDSYFNTENDLRQRNNVQMYLLGVNWQYRKGTFRLGATSIYYGFDRPIEPQNQPYNAFAFRGKENTNTSIDYQYRWKRVLLFGESAIAGNGAFATLNGMLLGLSNTFHTTLMQRSYAIDYHAYYGASFGEAGKVENEKGLYWGVQWNPFRYWRLSSYCDVFRFPWLKYGVDAPSEGYDVMAQVDYSPKENLKCYLRYRIKEKEQNLASMGGATAYVGRTNLQRMRWQCDVKSTNRFTFRTGVDYNYYQEEGAKGTQGFSLSQSVSKSFSQLPLELDAQMLVFNTESYDNLIYASEKNVLYAFSFPSFSGKGCRYALNLKYAFGKSLVCWVKYAQTNYFDRLIIGSGLEEIDGSVKRDLYVLLRYRF